jgi:mercuric ion transport protein
MKNQGASVWQTCKAITPGIGVSILVAAKCPACWLAYAGLLTMPGVAWLLGETSLMLLTVGLLAIALISLAYRAHDRWGYWPLALGTVAATLILIEKWWLSSVWLLVLGIILLVSASLWNAWPRRVRALDACVTCAPQASEGYEKAHN